MVVLDQFFSPKSVAVFGASRHLDKPGRVLLRNLINNFEGNIYPVHPKLEEIDGLKCYTPDSVPKADLGVFAIPAPATVDTLEKVGGKFKGALIIAGGFGESGRSDLDERLLKVKEETSIRIMGPNCLGSLNTHANFNSIFLPLSRLPFPPKGGVSILSQSGATVAAVLDWAGSIGMGISKVASYGNQLDVSDYEILDYFQKDKETDVIGFYIEGPKDGRKLLEVAREGKKPVVVLKAGKTEKGRQAAKSHTGALAGSYPVFKGVAEQVSWKIASGMEAFILALKTKSMWKQSVKNVGIVTCGGGFGVMTSDALEAQGLAVPELNKETQNLLKSEMPSRVSLKNPIDLTGDAPPELFALAIETMMRSPQYDAVVVIILLQLPKLHSEIIDVLNGFKNREKPVIVISPPGAYASGVNDLIELPLVSSPEKAARVLATL